MNLTFGVLIPEELGKNDIVGHWKRVRQFSARERAVDYLWMAWGILEKDADLFIEVEDNE